MTTASGWRMWFITERLHLHDLLVECIAEADDVEQKATVLCEHDLTLHKLAKHAARKITRADLVTVLARREEEMKC